MSRLLHLVWCLEFRTRLGGYWVVYLWIAFNIWFDKYIFIIHPSIIYVTSCADEFLTPCLTKPRACSEPRDSSQFPPSPKAVHCGGSPSYPRPRLRFQGDTNMAHVSCNSFVQCQTDILLPGLTSSKPSVCAPTACTCTELFGPGTWYPLP